MCCAALAEARYARRAGLFFIISVSAAEVISKLMGVERALPKISAFYWKTA
jgi:hypothetical protein